MHPLESSWGMFLSMALESGEAGRSRRGDRFGSELTVPMKSPVVYLPTTVPPFGPEPYFGDAAIPEPVA
jgi:hypothetical protein